MLHVLRAGALHRLQDPVEAVLQVRLADHVRNDRNRLLPRHDQANLLHQTFLHVDPDLQVRLLDVLPLELDALLHGKFGRLAEPPVPRGKVLAQLVQPREPLLGGVDQLEAELLHQQVTSAVGQLGGRRPQELVSNGSKQTRSLKIAAR